MREAKPDKNFLFVGNQTCLDFINTQMIQQGRLVDLLEDFSDLMAWMVQARILDAGDAKEAIRKWGGRREGLRTFAHARELRATLREMAGRIAAGQAVPQSAIEAINGLLRHRLGYAQLTKTSGGFERRFHVEAGEAIHLLAPIAESASDLLAHCDRALIKKCKNRACILFFYDTTKNHARHWCSMSICGNRMKVAEHYRRKRRTKGR
ncbi:MAG: hypothetical protein EPO02_03610 [Nitrospirae bacterium]|nr:MAG: hypothetical protein EPO02_03610 [Nitrospirota bacterium]